MVTVSPILEAIGFHLSKNEGGATCLSWILSASVPCAASTPASEADDEEDAQRELQVLRREAPDAVAARLAQKRHRWEVAAVPEHVLGREAEARGRVVGHAHTRRFEQLGSAALLLKAHWAATSG